jgi:hypothetical protein
MSEQRHDMTMITTHDDQLYRPPKETPILYTLGAGPGSFIVIPVTLFFVVCSIALRNKLVIVVRIDDGGIASD